MKIFVNQNGLSLNSEGPIQHCHFNVIIFVVCCCVSVAWILMYFFHVLIIMVASNIWIGIMVGCVERIQDAPQHDGTSNNVCKAVPEHM
jgi:hypothetical protein